MNIPMDIKTSNPVVIPPRIHALARYFIDKQGLILLRAIKHGSAAPSQEEANRTFVDETWANLTSALTDAVAYHSAHPEVVLPKEALYVSDNDRCMSCASAFSINERTQPTNCKSFVHPYCIFEKVRTLDVSNNGKLTCDNCKDESCVIDTYVRVVQTFEPTLDYLPPRRHTKRKLVIQETTSTELKEKKSKAKGNNVVMISHVKNSSFQCYLEHKDKTPDGVPPQIWRYMHKYHCECGGKSIPEVSALKLRYPHMIKSDAEIEKMIIDSHSELNRLHAEFIQSSSSNPLKERSAKRAKIDDNGDDEGVPLLVPIPNSANIPAWFDKINKNIMEQTPNTFFGKPLGPVERPQPIAPQITFADRLRKAQNKEVVQQPPLPLPPIGFFSGSNPGSTPIPMKVDATGSQFDLLPEANMLNSVAVRSIVNGDSKSSKKKKLATDKAKEVHEFVLSPNKSMCVLPLRVTQLVAICSRADSLTTAERVATFKEIHEHLDKHRALKNMLVRHAICKLIEAELKALGGELASQKTVLAKQFNVFPDYISFHHQFFNLCAMYPSLTQVQVSWNWMKRACLNNKYLHITLASLRQTNPAAFDANWP